ncbi:MAG: GTPase Era [Gammaproteobacteria bacterium]
MPHLPVAVVGRPNAGKSTLLNALAGHRASIVSHKPQTTRAVVRCQCRGLPVILEDTPGWQARYGDSFSRTLNAGAEQSASAAAVVVYVVAALNWHDEDLQLLLRLPPQCRIIIAVNKTDLLAKRDMLLPFFAEVDAICKANQLSPCAIIPVSALKKRGLLPLLDEVAKVLPAVDNANAKTLPDNKSNKSGNIKNAEIDGNDDVAFSFAEILREKLFLRLDGELPYRAAVIARTMPRRGKTLRVSAEVYVEKESQKAIVIGAGGEALKKTATAARRRMEELAGEKIFLTVRVRARKWRQDSRLLSQMRIGA